VDANEIALVESTFAAAAPKSDRLSTAFFEHLFAPDPTVRSMFADDLLAHRTELLDELAVIVDSLRHVPVLVERATEFGRRHVVDGVGSQHYELVLDALLQALSVCIPGEMSDDAVMAWRKAYRIVAETMRNGARHAGPALT
jgi:hemoglobin-like flavoprotein